MPYLPGSWGNKFLVILLIGMLIYSQLLDVVDAILLQLSGNLSLSYWDWLSMGFGFIALLLVLLKKPLGWTINYAIAVFSICFSAYGFYFVWSGNAESLGANLIQSFVIVGILQLFMFALLIAPGIRAHFGVSGNRIKYSTMFGVLMAAIAVFFTNNSQFIFRLF